MRNQRKRLIGFSLDKWIASYVVTDLSRRENVPHTTASSHDQITDTTSKRADSVLDDSHPSNNKQLPGIMCGLKLIGAQINAWARNE